MCCPVLVLRVDEVLWYGMGGCLDGWLEGGR